MDEHERLEEFWNHYCENAHGMRRACRKLLFQLSWPVQVREEISGLRLATLGDIEMAIPVHAQMALAESGINPLES